ncbi:hypothetical protein HY489_01510 [Candidatus Woesearchaeota archaeon]|nr:hypothetical protein [Candidatus Woesearchaeota archaeon]
MFVRSVSYREKERILMRALARAKPLTLKEEFSGSAPAPFVGHYGYPKVSVGILAPPEQRVDAWRFDAPREWAGENLPISEIVEFRTGLVNSRFVSDVKRPEKFVELAQEVAMADRPVDVDVSLEKRPSLNLTTDQWHAPLGPQARLKNVELASNPSIPTKVQRFFDDTDVKAAEAVTELYGTVDENSLMRMLSVGVFGKQRKLVPTRWSITATDDILGKDFLDKVKDLPVGDYATYFGSYLGNYYLILLFPEKWSYELFEMYVKPGVLEYSTDFEPFEGRKEYAQQCAGGYYTVRMAIAEHMIGKKRQGSCLVLRFITDDYLLPLGVWVTREATRKALSNKPIRFASKELMLQYAKLLAKKRFNVDVEHILNRSWLLRRQESSLQKWL